MRTSTSDALIDWPAIRRLASVNGDIVLRSLILQVAFVSLAALWDRARAS